MMDYKTHIEAYLLKLKKTIDMLSIESINELIIILVEARQEDKTIFIMGNGGSAATASHFVCDFNKGLSFDGIKKFKFISLNDNIPSLLAYANDLSYDEVFVSQLQNYFTKGDIVIGISGSGNSINVINAIKWANENGGITIGLTGFDGGHLFKIVKHNINIPINDMQITEDLHMVLDHCIMKVLSNSK